MDPINFTLPQYASKANNSIAYVTETRHAFSLGETVLVAAVFIFITYWVIRVRRNKEYYEHWKNPEGREVNLYKKINLLFYLFIGIVIIGGCLQIVLTKMYGG